MDKNQATGFVLMAALLMVWFYFFKPEPPVQTPEGVDTVNTIPTQPQQLNQNNSIIQEKIIDEPVIEIDDADLSTEKFGVFATALAGQEKDVILENDLIKINYSSKGGLAKVVALKEFDDFQFNKPLILFDEESSSLAELEDFIGIPIRFQVESLFTQEQYDVVIV